MMHLTAKWRIAAAALVAAASLAACERRNERNGAPTTTPTPPAAQGTVFSGFVIKTFANAENTTPVSLDNVVFNFDVENDPTAFNTLLM